MESTTTTMTIHSSSSTSTSTHPSSEASFSKVASPPSMTPTSASNLRVVVAPLVSSLRHHLSNISEVHPDPMGVSSQREPSHLIHSSCSGVNALILNCSPPILHFVADFGECAESVKLSLDHLASAPGPETSNPDLGCSVSLAISNLALELANILPAQLFFWQLQPCQGS